MGISYVEAVVADGIAFGADQRTAAKEAALGKVAGLTPLIAA